jgi:hypothetical protein
MTDTAAWPPNGALAARGAHLPMAEPGRAAATLALAGRAAARPEAPSVLLLGCGAGDTPALLAACGADVTVIEPHGPAAAAAAALLAAADLPGRVIHAPFHAAGDLGIAPFDHAAMAQGWSDAPDPDRDAIAALMGARLRAGGAFFVLHAVMPGGAEDMALRQLARAAWARTDPGLPAGPRAIAALAVLEDALPACHLLLRAHNGFEAEMDAIRALPPELAAERWFAAIRRPEGVTALGRRLRAAGLRDLAPADPMRLARDLDLTAEGAALVDRPSAWPADPSEAAFVAAELSDLATRRAMRADLLLKSAPSAPDPARAGAVLLRRMTGVEAALATPLVGFLGPHAAARAGYAPVLEAVPEDRAVALSEVAAAAGLTLGVAARRVAALIGQGALAPAATVGHAARIAGPCARLNAVLAQGGAEGWLAAPALGGAIRVGAAAMGVLAAVRPDRACPSDSPKEAAPLASDGPLGREMSRLGLLGIAPGAATA